MSPRNTAALILSLAALALLAACAGEVPWTNPHLSRKMAEHDYSECRRYADSMVGSGDGGGYYDDPRSSDPMGMVDRATTRRELDGLIGACMRDKGYFPTK